MAPESLKTNSYSKASDVWMFGVVLYEMWARRTPYHDRTAMQAVLAVTSTGSALPIEEGWPVASLINRCLEVDPARRPTIAQCRVELQDLLKTVQSQAAAAAAAEPSAFSAASATYSDAAAIISPATSSQGYVNAEYLMSSAANANANDNNN